MPALADLERDLRTDPAGLIGELTFLESGMIGRTPSRNPADRRQRIALAADKRLRTLLGPEAGLTDPLLSSRAAYVCAKSVLRDVLREVS